MKSNLTEIFSVTLNHGHTVCRSDVEQYRYQHIF